MDLAAFLAPGVHPVYRVGHPPEGEPWGHLLCRPGGRVSWVAKVPVGAGERLLLTLMVPGYRLEADGSLSESPPPEVGPVPGPGPGPVPGAWVVLSGQVRSCRPFQGHLYSLRLADLVRVLDL